MRLRARFLCYRQRSKKVRAFNQAICYFFVYNVTTRSHEENMSRFATLFAGAIGATIMNLYCRWGSEF
jgi:hypothetical protein